MVSLEHVCHNTKCNICKGFCFFLHVSPDFFSSTSCISYVKNNWFLPKNDDQNRGTKCVLHDRHCIQASNNMHSYRSCQKKIVGLQTSMLSIFIVALFLLSKEKPPPPLSLQEQHAK